MNWESFLAMGGYGTYIWTAYGITSLVLTLNLIKPRIQRKRLLRHLANRHHHHE